MIFQDKDGRWKTTLPDETKKSGRRLIAKAELSDLEENIITYYKEKQKLGKNKEDITLNDIFPEWLDYKSSHTRSSSYIKRIFTDWKTFYAESEIIHKPIAKLSYLYVDKWVHDIIREHDMTKKKFYNMSIILRQCLDYACEEGMIESNPMDKVKVTSKFFVKQPKPSRETQVFQVDEQEKISNAVLLKYQRRPDCTTPLAILFNFQVGLRIGELVALKWSDIVGNYLHVQRMEISTFSINVNAENEVKNCGFQIADYTKTDAGDRMIYLNQEAKSILAEVRKVNMKYGHHDDDFIFLTSDRGRRSTTTTITKYLEKLCISAGIINKSNHKIRKTYISSLFDLGVNIDTIRGVAGHEDERTSLKNYCFDQRTDQELENQLEKAKNSRTACFNKETPSL